MNVFINPQIKNVSFHLPVILLSVYTTFISAALFEDTSLTFSDI